MTEPDREPVPEFIMIPRGGLLIRHNVPPGVDTNEKLLAWAASGGKLHTRTASTAPPERETQDTDWDAAAKVVADDIEYRITAMGNVPPPGASDSGARTQPANLERARRILHSRQDVPTRHAYQPGGDFASVILGLRGIMDELTDRCCPFPLDWQSAMMADLVLMISDLEELAGEAAP